MANTNIIATIKQWRERKATQLGQPLFKVLNNATIEALAKEQPTTVDELQNIPGLGPKKIAQFGSELIALLQNQSDLFATTMATPKQASEATTSPETPLEQTPIGQRPEIIFQVSEALDYCNILLGTAPAMTIEGEFSSLSIHGGHMYATLQDPHDKSIINCFANAFVYQQFRQYCQEGLTVRITGHPSIYKQKGRFSFTIQSVVIAGEGALKQAYELTKQKLADEGLFSRKRSLPQLITKVGLITSQTGAVLADFRNNLIQRGIELVLYHVRVEGQQAISQIRQGIKTLNKQRPDLHCLVIMRGGGSLEDLAPFSDEGLVREVFGSAIPTIAAIGHDRDVPLACFAADQYTSTPTAAAVFINQSWLTIEALVEQQAHSLIKHIEHMERWCQSITERASRSLARELENVVDYIDRISLGFTRIIGNHIEHIQRLEQTRQQLGHKLVRAFEQHLDAHTHQLASAALKLEANDPKKPLRLGYTLTYNADGHIITQAKQTKPGETISVHFAQGHINATITNSHD